MYVYRYTHYNFILWQIKLADVQIFCTYFNNIYKFSDFYKGKCLFCRFLSFAAVQPCRFNPTCQRKTLSPLFVVEVFFKISLSQILWTCPVSHFHASLWPHSLQLAYMPEQRHSNYFRLNMDASFSILKKETECFSETSVSICTTTWLQNP